MPDNFQPFAKAEMLIRQPVADVFGAFVNPACTSKFWPSKGSGRLEPGKQVTWHREMYNFSVPVNVKVVEQNACILVEWSACSAPTPIEWSFQPRPDGTTFVSVTNRGFPVNETAPRNPRSMRPRDSRLCSPAQKRCSNTTSH